MNAVPPRACGKLGTRVSTVNKVSTSCQPAACLACQPVVQPQPRTVELSQGAALYGRSQPRGLGVGTLQCRRTRVRRAPPPVSLGPPPPKTALGPVPAGRSAPAERVGRAPGATGSPCALAIAGVFRALCRPPCCFLSDVTVATPRARLRTTGPWFCV